MKSAKQVFVVPTGVANLASVVAGLRRAGAAPQLAETPADVARAERVVLPGVGAFAPAIEALSKGGYAEPLRERIAAGRPTLGICLGMQVIFDASEESPGVAGLGAAPGTLRRFTRAVRVPQLGWNRIEAEPGCRFLQDGCAYFANSYRLAAIPPGWKVAQSDHGGRFVAALEKDDVLLCQFHPELSGEYGAALLRRWLSPEAAGSSSDQAGATVGGGAPRKPHSLPRVIPCLDVRDGRVVKGVKFQGLRDAGDPVERAAAYEAQGADELVLLDVSATPEGRATAIETVKQLRAVLGIPLTVGGGIRDVASAAALLEAGADKVAVNTAAVRDPSLLTALAARFGRQCTVLSLDAAASGDGTWETVVRSGTERTGRDAIAWAREATERGAGEILLTSWDRDGTQDGYDLPLLSAISQAVQVPVIASGGAGSVADLAAALGAGADAVLAASIFHDGHTTVAEVKQGLAELGVSVRLEVPA